MICAVCYSCIGFFRENCKQLTVDVVVSEACNTAGNDKCILTHIIYMHPNRARSCLPQHLPQRRHPTRVRIRYGSSTFDRAVLGPRWVSRLLCLCLKYLTQGAAPSHGRRPLALRALELLPAIDGAKGRAYAR